MSRPTVLTIAGSDSGGGAGIQADTKTIEAHSCFATSVITGLTAQNTVGVQDVFPIPPTFVSKQLQSVLDDLPPVAIKTGMLTSSEIILSVISTLTTHYSSTSLPQLVVDPVTISTSKDVLLPDNAISALCFDLLPLATIITPNIPETELILRCLKAGKTGTVETSSRSALLEINSLEKMIQAGKEIIQAIPTATTSKEDKAFSILVKGGHLPITIQSFTSSLKTIKQSLTTTTDNLIVERSSGLSVLGIETDNAEEDDCLEVLSKFRGHLSTTAGVPASEKLIVDVLISKSKAVEGQSLAEGGGEGKGFNVRLFVSPAVESTSTHGTGCTLSAAIASNLALGMSIAEAVKAGIHYTQVGIITAEPRGSGHGPLNHSCLTVPRTLPLPNDTDPHPFVTHLIRSTQKPWKEYVRHPFVRELGQGILRQECFKEYLIQDYIYLKMYARAHALAAFKSTEFADIQAMSEIALHVARESNMHVEFCKSYGVSFEDLRTAVEAPQTSAYGRYILDIGQQGDVVDLLVAVFSCLIGYAEVGLWLRRQESVEGSGISREGNPYARWMQDYSGTEFQDARNRGIALLERRIASDPPSPIRLERLTKIWSDCVDLEIQFWGCNYRPASEQKK